MAAEKGECGAEFICSAFNVDDIFDDYALLSYKINAIISTGSLPIASIP